MVNHQGPGGGHAVGNAHQKFDSAAGQLIVADGLGLGLSGAAWDHLHDRGDVQDQPLGCYRHFPVFGFGIDLDIQDVNL